MVSVACRYLVPEACGAGEEAGDNGDREAVRPEASTKKHVKESAKGFGPDFLPHPAQAHHLLSAETGIFPRLALRGQPLQNL